MLSLTKCLGSSKVIEDNRFYQFSTESMSESINLNSENIENIDNIENISEYIFDILFMFFI